MNMTEADKLSRIYNTLLMVHTSGPDTRIMASCLENFERFLKETEVVEDEVKTPIIGEGV